jgi:branched-chain amino acid transport system ATP-binding protein
MTNMLSVTDLDVNYGSSQVLFQLKLHVKKGETLALLGRNGAGKSTTMKAIAGVIAARRGRVELEGKAITGMPSHKIARAGIGFVPEDRQIFTDLSVEDNLLIATKRGAQGQQEWSIDRVYDMLPLLKPLRIRLGGQLSGGEQQMLTIGRSLMGNPDSLLLDEPSEGLAPVIVDQLTDLLNRLASAGTSILLVEQNISFVLDVVNQYSVLSKGRVIEEGSVSGVSIDKLRQHIAI